ncbi:ubinuclein-1-like isoform X2 [Andrographis paniculata]|uniref:ubinuclein-1-like isoform X2 n=1 Tax=Andrographis paniculata TaxID=175694 RepID=UPI0021E7781B|nr:ubinuclein-1-like isoform X2 [Andrographis paniculata]
MVEGGGGGGGPDPGSGPKPAAVMESAGGRIRFRVELRPEETTFVSWKKLLKESNLSDSTCPGQLNSGSSSSGKAPERPTSQAMPPSLTVVPCSSKQPAVNEQKDRQGQSGSNRLSSVIERIERLYAGNGSSDDENVGLDDVPDDDEYDTEDSFIDDTELDDYFQVDNSTIKHNGFFINRGKLEHIEPPPASTTSQPKKRRHKDLERGQGRSDDGHIASKIVKVGNKDKTAENRTTVDLSGLSNGGAIIKSTYSNQQKPEVSSSKKWKESNNQDSSTQRSNKKSTHVNKSYSGKQPNNADDLNQSVKPKEKGGIVETLDLSVAANRDTLPTTRKEGSSVRPKHTDLEKAIRELDKIVAESRPPSTEVQDPDNSSHAVKRRLPPEVKEKLGTVARILRANDGKIPKDIINRLMGIVGHLVQVRTLKRNLKSLATSGLCAKQEKENKMRKIKQEVVEMVKLQIPYVRSKNGPQAENSIDIQGVPEDNKVLKRKYKMDYALEDKICDLYDLYVERLEEDSGPPIRRLYDELVSMWPSGVMDINGIKRAIYRAKNRGRSSILQKDHEKIKKKKKASPAKAERAPIVTEAPKLLPDSEGPDAGVAAAHVPVTFTRDRAIDKTRKKKARIDAAPSNSLPKKKQKRKPNVDGAAGGLVADGKSKHHKKKVVPPRSKQTLLPA